MWPFGTSSRSLSHTYLSFLYIKSQEKWPMIDFMQLHISLFGFSATNFLVELNLIIFNETPLQQHEEQTGDEHVTWSIAKRHSPVSHLHMMIYIVTLQRKLIWYTLELELCRNLDVLFFKTKEKKGFPSTKIAVSRFCKWNVLIEIFTLCKRKHLIWSKVSIFDRGQNMKTRSVTLPTIDLRVNDRL